MAHEVYVVNKTNTDLHFILFQENGILDEGSYASVWYSGTVHADEGEKKVGPFIVPEEIKFSVEKHEEQQNLLLGPVEIAKGETWSYDGDALNLVGTDEEDTSSYVDTKNKDDSLSVSVWKGETRIFTQRNVSDKLEIEITKKIFVAAVDHKFVEGQQIPVLTLEPPPTYFDLTDTNREVIIVAIKDEHGNIAFTN